jgi:ABC-2 type transport system ATP-binding protein
VTSEAIAINVEGLRHSYGEHEALQGLQFQVREREIFGLLGPNGGGKTTLFRILSTLLPVQHGAVTLLGLDVDKQPAQVRYAIGVTFQSPSLDVKLTVRENLVHQAQLYGITGATMRERIADRLGRLGLSDRANDRVESLSGGLKRRVEIAKGLLHEPRVLLLDEPSTGLDPGARHDLWRYLHHLRDESGMTILVTTHLMEEADRCDRLGILDAGQLVALGTPDELRASVGGDCLTIACDHPEPLRQSLRETFDLESHLVGDQLRIEHADAAELVGPIAERFADSVSSITLGKPTLEDVFILRTGHRFWEGKEA